MPMDQRLYRALKKGDMKVVEEYKNQFATQLTPYNNTVLHVAAQHEGFLQRNPRDLLAMVCRDLLFTLNSNGDTFIHLAARTGNFNLVKGFIDYTKNCASFRIIDTDAGIQVEACRELLRITNNDGNTALHEAANAMHYHSHSVIKLLVKADADFSHQPNKAGKSPLYLAVEKGNKYSVEFILNNCSSPSYAGPYGTNVLHATATCYFAGVCMDMILRKEPSLTKQVDDFGWNPLHYAACLGLERPVKTLLMADKQMAYETIKKENKTPLHLAAINGNLGVIEEILKECPDSVEAVTSEGQNVLHLASANGHMMDIMDLLGQYALLSGIIDMKDADGNTPYNAKGKPALSHPCLEKVVIDSIRTDNARSPDYEESRKEMHEKMLKERMEEWKERANTHLIVATLITTVSFAAGFTIPGGYDGDDGPNKGMAVLWKKAAFRTFALTDTLAMISSTAAVFLHYQATYEQEFKRLDRYRTAGRLVMVAMVAMIIAFMTGLYIVLPSTGLSVFICVICSLSLTVFTFLLGKTYYKQL